MASIDIMSLKSDILFEFFNLVAATDAPRALPWTDPGPLHYHLGWIRLTHVCRLWRTLLIDEMPSLWAQVVCNLPSHTHDTVLARAQTQPLSLALNIDDTFGDESNHIPPDQRLPSEHTLRFHLRDFAVANVTRARNFRASSFGYDWLPVFKGVHLPHLTRVDLHQERRYGDETPVALLLPLDAPNLTLVKLHHIAATFTSTSIRGLTIHGTSMFCNREWSLVEVLRSLKQLEYLELEMRPSKMVDWRSQATSPIELASLKHIHVYGTEQANITALIELLKTPSPLEEHTYYVHIEPEGWERFVRVLGPMLRQKAFNALFFADDDSQIVASTFVAVDKPEDYPGSAVQEVTLEVEHGSDNERVKTISAAMLAHIDGARIEQIIFGYKIPDEKVDDARNALRGFHAVTSFAALTHDTLKVLRASDDGHIFPNLSLLVATIEKRYDPDAERLWDLDSLRAWWDLLCTVLEDRIRAGVPISRIRLASNASPIKPTDALREVEVEGLVKVLYLVPEVEDTRKVFETT